MKRAKKQPSKPAKRDHPAPSNAPDDAPDEVEQASEDSFPASDPPAWEPLHPGESAKHPDRRKR